jgi:heme-degrading monooxygenase HmoA
VRRRTAELEEAERMYARLVLLTGDPARMEESIRYIEETVRPAVTSLEGCRGMTFVADRERGKGVVATFWSSEEARTASAEPSRSVRETAIQRLGGTGTMENYEVAVFHQKALPGPGSGVRLTFTEGDPADVDLAIDAFRTTVVPRVELLPGFCRAILFVDRGRGRNVSAISFADQTGLTASRGAAASVRADATAKAHLNVRGVDEYEMVFTEVEPD